MKPNDPRAALLPLIPALRAYARCFVPQRAEADDLVQEALLRALAALSQFRPGSSMRAWLFVILRNTFYEQTRRRRNEQLALQRTAPPAEAQTLLQDARTDLADLQSQLFALPALLREALVLVGAHGMSYEDAAGVCSVPVGTMKARVSRARLQLARLMQHPAIAPEPADLNDPR